MSSAAQVLLALSQPRYLRQGSRVFPCAPRATWGTPQARLQRAVLSSWPASTFVPRTGQAVLFLLRQVGAEGPPGEC